MRAWQGILASAFLIVGGCFPQESKVIGASDPLANIPAMQDAVRDKDYRAIPKLIGQLDSDDPAVRFYAIQCLQSLTGGRTFGYYYYDDSDARKPAVLKWRQWLAQQAPAEAVKR